MLDHPCFVVKDAVTGPYGDAPEGRDGLAIELLDTKEHVGFVHCLEVEVGSDDPVAVDNGSTHICPNLRRVRSLDRCSTRWSCRETVQASHEQVNEIGRINTRKLGDVNVGDSHSVAPVSGDESDFPFEVVSVGLIGVSTGVLHGPLAHVPMLQASYFTLGESGMVGVGTPHHDPQAGISGS